MSESTKRIKEQITTSEQIQKLTARNWNNRLYNPEEQLFATESLLGQVALWKNRAHTTVFTSGVYDLMHLTHVGYLLDTKIQGSPLHYERKRKSGDKCWDTLDNYEQREVIEEHLATDALKLIVSVDGDDWVMKRKGFDPAKGNSTRPIHSWQIRARNVASATYQDYDDVIHHTADAITIHDPVSLDGKPHEDTIPLAEQLQPDVWSIFYESQDIIDGVSANSQLKSTEARILTAGDYFEDRLVGNFSTTAVVKRILSGQNGSDS